MSDATEKRKVFMGTHNEGKIQDLKRLETEFPSPWKLERLPDRIDTHVEEDGSTYLENAIKKASTFYERLNDPSAIVLADDSGLEIDALPTLLGVHSNRFLGENADPNVRMEELVRMMLCIPKKDRTARFVSTIVLYSNPLSWETWGVPDDRYLGGQPKILYGTGTMEGYIDTVINDFYPDPGFGYNPIFVVGGLQLPFSCLDAYTRTCMNHRAKAYIELVHAYKAFHSNLVSRATKFFGSIENVPKTPRS